MLGQVTVEEELQPHSPMRSLLAPKQFLGLLQLQHTNRNQQRFFSDPTLEHKLLMLKREMS